MNWSWLKWIDLSRIVSLTATNSLNKFMLLFFMAWVCSIELCLYLQHSLFLVIVIQCRLHLNFSLIQFAERVFWRSEFRQMNLNKLNLNWSWRQWMLWVIRYRMSWFHSLISLAEVKLIHKPPSIWSYVFVIFAFSSFRIKVDLFRSINAVKFN